MLLQHGCSAECLIVCVSLIVCMWRTETCRRSASPSELTTTSRRGLPLFLSPFEEVSSGTLSYPGAALHRLPFSLARARLSVSTRRGELLKAPDRADEWGEELTEIGKWQRTNVTHPQSVTEDWSPPSPALAPRSCAQLPAAIATLVFNLPSRRRP